MSSTKGHRTLTIPKRPQEDAAKPGDVNLLSRDEELVVWSHEWPLACSAGAWSSADSQRGIIIPGGLMRARESVAMAEADMPLDGSIGLAS
jgi:hypothetical protein